MTLFLWSMLSGWAASFALLRTTIFPFEKKGAANAKPYIVRLQPHYWLSFFSLGAAALHASVALDFPRMAGANRTGLWLAAIGLLFMLLQASIGLALQYPFPGRRYARRAHLGLCFALVPLVVAHVALN